MLIGIYGWTVERISHLRRIKGSDDMAMRSIESLTGMSEDANIVLIAYQPSWII